jgi:iron(III) transport system substrate-binding protein|tara:strand:- start:460 stop:1527 length:1068 start_codon:yes stop_codon:yes gene_type:complete
MYKHLISVLVAFTLIVTACGSSDRLQIEGLAAEINPGECAETTDRTVTIYSGRKENLIEPVLEAFTCATGIDTEVRWGSSTQLALLIDEEANRSAADIFLSQSPGPVGFLESKDLLGTISAELLSLVSEENRSTKGSWIGFSGRKRVLVHNIDLVTDDELPTSVFELTDEKWRGKVAIPGTNGSFVDWFTVFRDQYGTDVATKWLNDMVENDARYYPNNRSIVEAAGRGEIEMGLVNHYYNYQEVAAAGDAHRAKNHDLDDNDIGSLLIITAATVLASAKNQTEAHELLAYLLSAAVQNYFTNQTLEYPLAAGVKPNAALPPLTALEIGSVDFDALGGGFDETARIIEASGIQNQ